LAPYAIWVSEIMLQQTQVKTVIPYWERWMRELPDVAAMARAKPEKVLKLWEGLGYYSRARNMHKAAGLIVAQNHGSFPKRFDDVLALPGIGRYTAGAICSIAFNQPMAILDGNVFRVLARLFGVKGSPREKSINTRLWGLAQDLVSFAAAIGTPGDWNCSRCNQALMELGALVCTPTQPQCALCPVRSQCVAHRSGRVESLPSRTSRSPTTARRFVAFVTQNGAGFLVRQRPAGVVNAGFWEFPNAEIFATSGSLEETACSLLSASPIDLRPLCVIKHTITRYRITLAAYQVQLKGQPNKHRSPGQWLSLDALELLPFTSAHRKILQKLK
jgi:A/G-specific adenine glycosylase